MRCGGGENHRVGLVDAVLIKRTTSRPSKASRPPSRSAAPVTARHARGRGRVADAVAPKLWRPMPTASCSTTFRSTTCAPACSCATHAGKRKQLEASGSVDAARLKAVAATGVDFISIEAITCESVSAIGDSCASSSESFGTSRSPRPRSPFRHSPGTPEVRPCRLAGARPCAPANGDMSRA